MKDKIDSFICPHCGKEFNKYGIKGHIWKAHTKEGQNHKPHEKVKPWNKGLTKETDNRVLKGSQNIIKAFKDGANPGWYKHHRHSKETKNILSQQAKERYMNGWEVRCGRAKKYNYNSKVCGNIKVDGMWELAVSYYLDSINVVWKRNTKRFPYINLKGNDSTYCPDFWIEDWNTYLEVKGYETDLDKCKWKQFTENLIIWKADKLIELNIINKVGEVAESVKALVC